MSSIASPTIWGLKVNVMGSASNVILSFYDAHVVTFDC